MAYIEVIKVIWISFSSVIIVLVLCIFAIYKWIKAEKRVNELQEDKHGLQLDKLHLEREVSWLKNKDNKNNIGKYVVELKKGVYLVKKYIGSYGNTCIITDNVFEALSYDDLYSAKEDACSFNGRVLEHKPNLEVVKQCGA